jgi:hypothetical protein
MTKSIFNCSFCIPSTYGDGKRVENFTRNDKNAASLRSPDRRCNELHERSRRRNWRRLLGGQTNEGELEILSLFIGRGGEGGRSIKAVAIETLMEIR